MASLSAPLTRYVVFKVNANNKYLALVKEGKEKWFIKACEDSVSSPLARFEVVSPTKEEYQKKGYVHIKSWYNNRFLRCDQSSSCLEAVADEPEEDITKGTGTLFEPHIVDNDTNIVKLSHVQIGNSTGIPRTRILSLEIEAEDPALTIRDYNSVAVLPSNVAFQGDNNKFLCTGGQDLMVLSFNGDDIGDITASFEVDPSRNADMILIMSTSNGKYWTGFNEGDPERLLGPIIRPVLDYVSVKNSTNGWFKPVQLDETTVALQNWGEGHLFCGRYFAEWFYSRFPTITNETKLVVFEAVVRRTITEVQYDIDNASIYDITDVILAKKTVQNNTSSDNSATLQIQYEDSTTSTFTRGCTFKVSVQTSFQSGIPLIAESKITVGAEIVGDFQWSKTTTKATTVSSSYTVNVPAYSVVTISAVGKRGTCNVPFSYVQNNVLYNGQTETKVVEDGMYKGSNYYDVTFISDEANKL